MPLGTIFLIILVLLLIGELPIPIAPAGSRTGQPSRPRPGCRAHSRIDRQNLTAPSRAQIRWGLGATEPLEYTPSRSKISVTERADPQPPTGLQ